MTDPPLEGAAQLSKTVVLPGVATRPVGAEGTVTAGTTALEAAELALVPSEFLAVTLKV
jgi:hypothetical protein